EPGEKRTISPDEPFVQILDPATGTATFLVEVIAVIHRTLAAKWKQQRLTDAQLRAAWNDYVPQHLLPRLHAFELMMAPYAIAHMKIGLKLAETGYRFGTEERARIYLTNALEPWVKQLPLIGFDALAHEAAAVNEIKRHKRFTVVIGNPPYAGVSSNMSETAQRMVDAYRKVDGAALNERKLWLQDDYVKFIRKAQATIDNAGVGVFGYITNHGYLDNPTFRGMRQSLMATFSRLRVLDLHGNANKREQPPDGIDDKNVFDIRQGVAICLATRGGGLPAVEHTDVWGSQQSKYDWFDQHRVTTTNFAELTPDAPFYFFEPQNTDCRAEYDAGFKLTEAMPCFGLGFQSSRDHLVVAFDKAELEKRLEWFLAKERSDTEVRNELFPGKVVADYAAGDTRQWSLSNARRVLRADPDWRRRIRKCLYRPFDSRVILYDKRMVDWPRPEVLGHMLRPNLCLITNRQSKEDFAALCTADIPERKIAAVYDASSSFPLYLLLDDQALKLSASKQPNFSHSFLKALAANLGLQQTKPHGLPTGLTPEDIFHYAYAVFHSPGYRSRYAEFLKIDFPRLPLTGNQQLFRALARLGGELTALHLLESPKLAQPITEFIGDRNPKVEKISWSKNTVWLDKTQTTGFRGVREEVWNFHIGGYQVCQKWLKDRKGRELTQEDLAHYQKIVVALAETIRLMVEIDIVIGHHGGWPGAFAADTLKLPTEKRIPLTVSRNYWLEFVVAAVRYSRNKLTLPLLWEAHLVVLEISKYRTELEVVVGSDTTIWETSLATEPINPGVFREVLESLAINGQLKREEVNGCICLTLSKNLFVTPGKWRAYDAAAILAMLKQRPEIVDMEEFMHNASTDFYELEKLLA
ncbi:MAG: type ISP restriction/modification enzyme, partial [Chthoniobacterales bacterium]